MVTVLVVTLSTVVYVTWKTDQLLRDIDTIEIFQPKRCADFDGDWEKAQRFYLENPILGWQLDGDRDGMACESLR